MLDQNGVWCLLWGGGVPSIPLGRYIPLPQTLTGPLSAVRPNIIQDGENLQVTMREIPSQPHLALPLLALLPCQFYPQRSSIFPTDVEQLFQLGGGDRARFQLCKWWALGVQHAGNKEAVPTEYLLVSCLLRVCTILVPEMESAPSK